MGNSNSITNEECDAKIRKMIEEGEKKGKETGKQEYIKKMIEKKDMIFNILIEGLNSGKFKERIFFRIRSDRDIYIKYITDNVMGNQISVPDIEEPTDEEKREYISRISDNINDMTDRTISTFDRELTSEINDEKEAKLKRELDKGMEILLEVIEKDDLKAGAADNSANFLADIIYTLLVRGDLHKSMFNRHKGVTYNPPYIDGSAGGHEVEPFVNDVEDENKFSKILLVLIVVVLFLHLFTDFKIF